MINKIVGEKQLWDPRLVGLLGPREHNGVFEEKTFSPARGELIQDTGFLSQTEIALEVKITAVCPRGKFPPC